MYVYIRTESNLFSVGHYTPTGEFYAESDFNSKEQAAARVAYLNGGGKEKKQMIILLEEFYGMYDLKYEKGDRVVYDRETESGYHIIVGHGQENVIPKSKAMKV